MNAVKGLVIQYQQGLPPLEGGRNLLPQDPLLVFSFPSNRDSFDWP